MKKEELTLAEKLEVIKTNLEKGDLKPENSSQDFQWAQKLNNLSPEKDDLTKHAYFINILHEVCESGKHKPDPIITDAKQIEAWYNSPDIYHK